MASDYIDDLYAFLAELKANNNRPWFAANRARYEELRACWNADLGRLIGAMSRWEPALAGQTPRSCSYRFYRDTRFSSDKSPFKLYFSAAITPWGRKTDHAGYYIQTGMPDDPSSGLYAGVWCPEAPLLRKLRHAIVDNIEEFESILAEPSLRESLPLWCGETLKTIPKGWPRNHPCAELLRRKDYGREFHCGREFFADPDWPLAAAARFEAARPFVDFLNYSIDE